MVSVVPVLDHGHVTFSGVSQRYRIQPEQGSSVMMRQSFCVTAVLAALLSPQLASAAIVQRSFSSNAVNYCQAFTPGLSNTIRNRVVGTENIGSSPVAVACAFHSLNDVLNVTDPEQVIMYFSNNSAVNITVNCTMLTGYQGSPAAYAKNKSVTVGAMTSSAQSITYNSTDNPTPGATTLGNPLIGVNCTLPTGAVINQIRMSWTEIV